jgi:DNA repair exonuclease SbcCD ATPase subunit
MTMLQIEDALDHFKKAVKNIQADKKAVADAKAKAVVTDLDALNKTLEKLKDRKKKLQDCISEISKIKTDVKNYNDDQHSFMRAIKDIGVAAGKVTPDTKTSDFQTISKDATQLQALNDLESS